MQNAVRTTIRIRKDLLHQSKLVALSSGTSLQEVINQVLAQGFGTITDLDTHKSAMVKIDKVRQSLQKDQADVKNLIEENKKELQARTDQVLERFK